MTDVRALLVARKDLMDAVRGRQAHLLVALFGLFGAFLGYTADRSVGPNLPSLLVFLVPLVGVAFTQHAVVGKRESGELAVLLGLPFSRRDVVLGTYLGRVGLVAVAVLSAYASAVIVGLLSGASPDVGAVGSGALVLVTVGTISVSVALAISMVVRSNTTASALAFVGYLGLVLPVWQSIPDAVLYVTNGFESPGQPPEWATVFEQLAPFVGLRNAVTPVAGDLVGELGVVSGDVPPDPPVYMQPWFGAVVLVAWVLVPAVLGYRRFQREDL